MSSPPSSSANSMTTTTTTVNKQNGVSSSSSPPPRSRKQSHSKSPSSHSAVQHDQITMSSAFATHSSASYKQELMDSSVLLDDINEQLSLWESQDAHSQSLQPLGMTSSSSNLSLFAPSTMNNDHRSDRKQGKQSKNQKNHHRAQQRKDALIDIGSDHRPSSHLRKSKKHKKTRSPLTASTSFASTTKNGINGSGTGSNSLSERGVVTVAGPHQTYYVRDDVAIKNGRKDSKSRSKRHRHPNGSATRNRFQITYSISIRHAD